MAKSVRRKGNWFGWCRANRRSPWKLLVRGEDKEDVRLRLLTLAGIDRAREDCEAEVMVIGGRATPEEVLAAVRYGQHTGGRGYRSRD
jgi:hypothetical protein